MIFCLLLTSAVLFRVSTGLLMTQYQFLIVTLFLELFCVLLWHFYSYLKQYRVEYNVNCTQLSYLLQTSLRSCLREKSIDVASGATKYEFIWRVEVWKVTSPMLALWTEMFLIMLRKSRTSEFDYLRWRNFLTCYYSSKIYNHVRTGKLLNLTLNKYLENYKNYLTLKNIFIFS